MRRRLILALLAAPVMAIPGCQPHHAASARPEATAGPASPGSASSAPTASPSPSASPAPPAHWRNYGPALLPDAVFTPGEAYAGVGAAQVCSNSYRLSHTDRTLPVDPRNYYQVTNLYGVLVGPHTIYQLDHLIPVSLGGDNNVRNLWPQPGVLSQAAGGAQKHVLVDLPGKPGYVAKNQLEAALRQLVCAGSLSLALAQRVIATNWYQAYGRYVSAPHGG